MSTSTPRLLLHGLDTVQCAYYLHAPEGQGVDFRLLAGAKAGLRQQKSREPYPVTLGTMPFFLYPYGSPSGYPYVLRNEDFKIELGEFNTPSFYVTFTSQALWRESAFLLHEKFLQWAAALGLIAKHPESLSRVDFSFDYALPVVDFHEDCFVSLSSKDSQHREDGQVQTFTLGRGDVVLRVYDKVAEIKQQSDKVWFYLLWGQDANVWRVEWQVRKPILRDFGIRTFADLQQSQQLLLTFLANTHDTLRQPTTDTNRSRWPLHPLWVDLQARIAELDGLTVARVLGQQVVLLERQMRLGISMYGYLKRLAAVHCVQHEKPTVTLEESLRQLGQLVQQVHEPLDWHADVEKRITAIRLGQW